MQETEEDGARGKQSGGQQDGTGGEVLNYDTSHIPILRARLACHILDPETPIFAPWDAPAFTSPTWIYSGFVADTDPDHSDEHDVALQMGVDASLRSYKPHA